MAFIERVQRKPQTTGYSEVQGIPAAQACHMPVGISSGLIEVASFDPSKVEALTRHRAQSLAREFPLRVLDGPVLILSERAAANSVMAKALIDSLIRDPDIHA